MKQQSFFDPELLQREYHNPNTFKVFFTRIKARDFYVLNAGKRNLGPEVVALEPDGFCYLPHGYYVVTGEGHRAGEPIKLLMNLEKQMFKGNRIPSNIRGQNE
jgi:hypothetical protein